MPRPNERFPSPVGRHVSRARCDAALFVVPVTYALTHLFISSISETMAPAAHETEGARSRLVDPLTISIERVPVGVRARHPPVRGWKRRVIEGHRSENPTMDF